MSNDHAHSGGYKQYFMIWGWLLVMTLLALGIGYIHGIPPTVKSVVLVSITLADRKSTRLNSSHVSESRMPSSA